VCGNMAKAISIYVPVTSCPGFCYQLIFMNKQVASPIAAMHRPLSDSPYKGRIRLSVVVSWYHPDHCLSVRVPNPRKRPLNDQKNNTAIYMVGSGQISQSPSSPPVSSAAYSLAASPWRRAHMRFQSASPRLAPRACGAQCTGGGPYRSSMRRRKR
jgi:hypothetical protein